MTVQRDKTYSSPREQFFTFVFQLWDCEYKPLDPKDIRLPIPQPPSERLLAAIEAFYALPSHDRPRDQ